MLEYIAGTNPADPLSVFRAEINRLADNSGFRVSWSRVASKSYRIARSDHPAGPWQTASSGIAATQPINQTDLSMIGARRFMRIAVE